MLTVVEDPIASALSMSATPRSCPPEHRMSDALTDRESCPTCGSAVRVVYGPDIRFTPPCTSPRMWRAECGGNCIDSSLEWTAFTRDRALEMWNSGIRKRAAAGASMP